MLYRDRRLPEICPECDAELRQRPRTTAEKILYESTFDCLRCFYKRRHLRRPFGLTIDSLRLFYRARREARTILPAERAAVTASLPH